VTETVTITPDTGFDGKGNPKPGGTPFTVPALEIAPGNTQLAYGVGGDLDKVEFTVFLPLRMREADGWVSVAEKATDNFSVEVRERFCRGRAQVWQSGGRGGVVVLCHSATGRSA
jgi:hypothetical protein